MDPVAECVTRLFKEAIHELLLTGSCHAVLFRGFVNAQLQLQPPTHGYNAKVEEVYKRICDSLGKRLNQMILVDGSFMKWETISDFINETTTCLHAIEELYQILQVYANIAEDKNVKKSIELYMYSIHHIGYKVEEFSQLYRSEFLHQQDDILSQACDFL
jgi:hypothetical protein